MAHAYCFRSGEIEIATHRSDVPDGAIVFASGRRKKLEENVEARARHAYKPGVLLVPGVPEAEDDAAAFKALHAWKAWAFPNAQEGGAA